MEKKMENKKIFYVAVVFVSKELNKQDTMLHVKVVKATNENEALGIVVNDYMEDMVDDNYYLSCKSVINITDIKFDTNQTKEQSTYSQMKYILDDLGRIYIRQNEILDKIGNRVCACQSKKSSIK
jgi:hypothetical protein